MPASLKVEISPQEAAELPGQFDTDEFREYLHALPSMLEKVRLKHSPLNAAAIKVLADVARSTAVTLGQVTVKR